MGLLDMKDFHYTCSLGILMSQLHIEISFQYACSPVTGLVV